MMMKLLLSQNIDSFQHDAIQIHQMILRLLGRQRQYYSIR